MVDWGIACIGAALLIAAMAVGTLLTRMILRVWRNPDADERGAEE